MLTFELLPNELLMKFFEYLNAPEVLYSFQRLNSRFEQLHRTALLHLSFQHMKKSSFDQFCQKLLSNPSIKRQIFSLKLSNENETCCQIQAFLSLFSLEEFPRLRSLTLIDVKQDEMNKIQSILSSLSNLRYFSMNFPGEIKCSTRIPLSMLNYPTLSIPIQYADFNSIPSVTSITYLTLSSNTSWNNLNQIFKCLPWLKYLNIEKLSGNDPCLIDTCANLLRKIILRTHGKVFNHLEILFKHTPNLEALTLYSFAARELINATRWEHLISFCLPYLNYFRFKLNFFSDNLHESTDVGILEKIQQFQTDFWQKQHHWFTAYKVDKDIASLYTVPYLSNVYVLTMYTHVYSEHSFDNITHLELLTGALGKDFPYYFSNIKSLGLHNVYHCYGVFDQPSEQRIHLESLQRIVNLSKLKHLDIGTICRTETSAILFEIFQQAPQLSSIKIDASALISLMNDGDLCKDLNKIIRKLDVIKHNNHLNISSSMIEKFCKIFSNIEQLRFPIQRSDDLFIFLKHLSNLSNISVHCLFFPFNANLWAQEMKTKLNRDFLFETIQDNNDIFHPKLHLWIGENMVVSNERIHI